MREDNKGQNIIDYAYKYKMNDIIETLVELGVPCSAEVKRKIGKNKVVVSKQKYSSKSENENDSDDDEDYEN